ncbi:GNAT family N-acetyltransferase [Candidatus Dojkabacteria bacterium]|nr:GNAT family N-acetyltransferase [Candidatus Dojkabacteria bacterium]
MNLESKVKLESATVDKWNLLQNLLFLYAYDFSIFTDDDVSECGKYNLGRLLRYYWNNKNPDPIIIRFDENIAGFVMLKFVHYRSEERLSISEFFILKKYRKKGLGTFVAEKIFDEHKCKWYLDVVISNEPADTFWNKVISKYTKGEYLRVTNEKKSKIIYTFSNE